MSKLLTISEAADRLNVTKQTLRRWDESGKFRAQRHPINNYRVYPNEQIDQFVDDINIPYGQPNLFRRTIEPFFQTSRGMLYNTDAVDFLKSLDDGSVRLIFADPPYNIKKAEWDTFESQKEYVRWSMEWIEESHRVLRPDGSLYICGFSEILADLKWAASSLFKGCKWIVWYYRNKANLANDWGRSHESLLHFRKNKNHLFNLDEVRIPYNEHTLKYPQHPQAQSSQYGNGKKHIWTPHPKGAKPKDVLEVPTLSNSSWERVDHPTQKPVELVKKCILASSCKDDLIVDPFGGSGTTFAVAEAFERFWAGSELNKKYCKTIKTRVRDEAHIARIADGRDELEAIQRRRKLRG